MPRKREKVLPDIDIMLEEAGFAHYKALADRVGYSPTTIYGFLWEGSGIDTMVKLALISKECQKSMEEVLKLLLLQELRFRPESLDDTDIQHFGQVLRSNTSENRPKKPIKKGPKQRKAH